MFHSIIDWLAWSQYTPVIPKFYVNAKSLEKANIELACRFDKLIHYIQYVVDNYNILIKDYNNFKKETNKKLDNLQQQIDQIKTVTVEDDPAIYDPSIGDYIKSQEAMRHVYQQLSVFGQKVSEMAEQTVEEAAKNTNDEHSIIGNYIINGNKEPRAKGNA